MFSRLSQAFILTIIILFQQTKAQFPPYVWIFWDSGFSSMPMFTKVCLQKTINILNNTKWQIIQINKTNIPSYLSKEEMDTIQQLFTYNATIQVKSDFVRLALLNRYGGVYFDATGFLLEDLNWLDYISTNPLQMYKIQEQIQFFAFSNIERGQENIFSTRREVMTKGKFQSSFLASMPNSTFGLAWIERLIEKARSDKKNNQRYNYWIVYDAQIDLIRQKQFLIQIGVDKENKTFQQAFKLATINVNQGMYYFDYYEKSGNQQFINKVTTKILKERYNLQPKYYIKQNHFDSNYLHKYFQYYQKGQLKEDYQVSNVYPQYQTFFHYFQSLRCLGKMYLIQGSITYKNLITQENYNPYKVIKQENLPLLCRYNLNILQLRSRVIIFLIYPIIFGFCLFVYIKIGQKLTTEQQDLIHREISNTESLQYIQKQEEVHRKDKISSSNFVFEFTKIELIFWICVISHDFLEKILFSIALWCQYSALLMFFNVLFVIGLILSFKTQVSFVKMVTINIFIAFYGLISLYLHEYILYQLSDSPSFHKNTLLRMTIRRIFMFYPFLYGYIFFRIFVIIGTFRSIRSTKQKNFQ